MTAAVSLRYPAPHLPSRPLRTTRDRNTTMCRVTHAPVARLVGHLRRGHPATHISTGHSRPAPKRAPTAYDPVERACSAAEASKQHPPLCSRRRPKPPSFPSRPDFAFTPHRSGSLCAQPAALLLVRIRTLASTYATGPTRRSTPEGLVRHVLPTPERTRAHSRRWPFPSAIAFGAETPQVCSAEAKHSTDTRSSLSRR